MSFSSFSSLSFLQAIKEIVKNKSRYTLEVEEAASLYRSGMKASFIMDRWAPHCHIKTNDYLEAQFLYQALLKVGLILDTGKDFSHTQCAGIN